MEKKLMSNAPYLGSHDYFTCLKNANKQCMEQGERSKEK